MKIKTIFNLFVASAVSLMVIDGCSSNKESKSIKVVSWGGTFQNDLMNYWIKPASSSVNMTVDQGTWDGDYSALTSKIKKNINAWDMVHVEDYYVKVDNKNELFTEIPEDIEANINPKYKNQYAVPILEYGYILAARKDLIGKTDCNTLNWAAIWDTKNIHGHRCLRDFPLGNIEIAMLADGKDINTYLYDPNISKIELMKRIDAAIAKFDAIKTDIVWFTTGDQLQKSMESGEAVLSAAWSGRVASAFKTLCKNESYNNCNLVICPKTALISVDWWIIPKNSANKENAINLLRSAYSSASLEKAKGFSERQGYSLPLSEFSLSDKNELYFLNAGSSRSHEAIGKINDAFWSKNFTWINKKWEDWRFK